MNRPGETEAPTGPVTSCSDPDYVRGYSEANALLTEFEESGLLHELGATFKRALLEVTLTDLPSSPAFRDGWCERFASEG